MKMHSRAFVLQTIHKTSLFFFFHNVEGKVSGTLEVNKTSKSRGPKINKLNKMFCQWLNSHYHSMTSASSSG